MEAAMQLDPQEHEKIKSLVETVRKSEGEFFRAAVQKQEMEEVCATLMTEIRTANTQLQSEMNVMKEKYGDIVINLQDGTYEYSPEAPSEAPAPEMKVVQ
jgi:tRNA A37 threonylcarbamoyltransferase TsaD